MNPIKRTIYGLIKKIKVLPSPFYAKIHYEYYTRKPLNIENPKEFNEKIHWLKVYFRPSILTKLVDKFEVRDYVQQTIGAQYLNSTIGVYNNVNEVDFDKLPEKFVLKVPMAAISII